MKTGRPLWWVAGLSLFLVLATGVVAWLVVVDDDPYVAPPPPASSASSPSPALAAEALQELVRAVRTGDVDAARALAPAGDAAAADRLAGVVANARAARVQDFSLRYVDAEGAYAGGAWHATADATWRFAGFDRSPATAEVAVSLQDESGEGGDRVAITGIGGGGRISPLWMSGPLQVLRTDRTLVLVDGSPREARDVARHAAAAVPVVQRVLPQWHGGLVLEVPASVRALDRVLDADPGTYDQIAAATTSADGQLTPQAPVHVFVNRDVYDGLRPTGAQVVISHEATHVATEAFRSTMPLWVVEGFADYVALRDVALPVRRSAAQIIAEVRKDGAPRSLPSDADFGSRTPDLGAMYESAWLANRLLAQDGGEAALVRFYRDVDGGMPVGRALQAELGLGVPGFTEQWRTLLRDLAS